MKNVKLYEIDLVGNFNLRIIMGLRYCKYSLVRKSKDQMLDFLLMQDIE